MVRTLILCLVLLVLVGSTAGAGEPRFPRLAKLFGRSDASASCGSTASAGASCGSSSAVASNCSAGAAVASAPLCSSSVAVASDSSGSSAVEFAAVPTLAQAGPRVARVHDAGAGLRVVRPAPAVATGDVIYTADSSGNAVPIGRTFR